MGGSFTIKRQQDITSDLIRYLLGNTQNVTDYSEGSVVRSLCEAISQEIYFSNLGFAEGIYEAINTSIKEVFDQPLLQPQKSFGLYTFYRSMLTSPIEIHSAEAATSNDDGTLQYFTYGLLPQGKNLYYGVSGYKKRLSGSDRTTKFETEASPYKFFVPNSTSTSFLKGVPAILKWIWSPDFEGYYIYRSLIDPALLTDILNVTPVDISYVKNSSNGLYGTFWFSVCGEDSSGKLSVSSLPEKYNLVNESMQITVNAAAAPNATSFKFFRTSVGMPYNDKISIAESGGSGATFYINTNSSGSISSVSINSGGQNYKIGDVLSIDGPGTPPSANKHRISILSVNEIGKILTFSTTNTGSGYTTAQIAFISNSTLEKGFLLGTKLNYSVCAVNSSGTTSPFTSIISKTISSHGPVKFIFPLVSNAKRYHISQWIGEISLSESSSVNYYSTQKKVVKLNPSLNESNQTETSLFLRPSINSTSGVVRLNSNTGGMGAGTWTYKLAPLFYTYGESSSEILGQLVGIVSLPASITLTDTAESLQINFSWNNNFLTVINSQVATPLKGIRLYRKGPSDTNWFFKDFVDVSNLTNQSLSIIDRPSSGTVYAINGIDNTSLLFGWNEISTSNSYYNPIYHSMIDSSELKPFPIAEIFDTSELTWFQSTWISQENYPMADSVSAISLSSSKNILNWQNVTTEKNDFCPLVYRIADIQSSTKLNVLSDTMTIGYGTMTNEKIGKSQASVSESSNESYFVWADNGRSPASAITNWPLINTAQAVEGELLIPYGTRVGIPNTTNIYETIESKSLSESENEKIVTIRALYPGSTSNTDANTITSILNAINGISSGTNILPLTSGKNIETEEEWRIRFSKTLRQLARGTRDSIEEGAKQAVLLDENGNIIEEIKFSFAFEETSTSVRLYVHNGTETQVSENLRKKCQLLINGYEEQGVIYPGYKPAGVPVTVSSCQYENVDITLQIIVNSGYTLSTLQYSIEYIVKNYVNSLDIGNGFDVSVLSLNPLSTISPSSGDTQNIQYKIVLVDNFYQKGIPSNTLTVSGINVINPQSISLQWTIPTEMGSRISYSEILRWNNSEESWKLISSQEYDSTDANSLKYTDTFSSLESSYNFSTMSRNVFQKSVLIQRIMRVPGVAAVIAQCTHGTPATEKEIIVPLTGHVLKINNLIIR